MALLEEPDIVEKLVPGFVALVLALIANVVTKPFWQLTGHRHYVWFVGPAVAVAYALLFVFHLKGRCAGLSFKQFAIVHALAILMVFEWVDTAYRVINCGLDRSTPVDVAAKVVGVDQRKASYFVKLTAPPAFDRSEIAVGGELYNEVRVGASVLVTWHKGTLGDGWCGRHPVRIEVSPGLQ